jgi:DNA-binding response OmpR family regulator
MSEAPNTTKHVLLVDDDVFLLDMYSMKFKKAGFEVSAVKGVDEAVEFLHDADAGNKPDIILFDLVMPGREGWELITEVREKKLAPDAKLVVLSNQGQEADLEESRKQSVDGYIIKAMTTPSEVVDQVEHILQTK